MTEQVRFSVEAVFDLSNRAGLLASGKVLAGVIRPGMILLDEDSGRSAKVLGVEFQSPADRRTGRTTLLVERTRDSPVTEGRTLTATT